MEKFPVEAGDIIIGNMLTFGHLHKMKNGTSLMIHSEASTLSVMDETFILFNDIKLGSLLRPKVLQSTDDSRYVLVRDREQKLSFCVVDLVERKTRNLNVDWWKGEKPTSVMFGPPGCVIMTAIHSIVIANYTERDAIHYLETIDLPHLEIVDTVYHKGRIFARSLSVNSGLWMITLEPRAMVKLFEASKKPRNPFVSNPMEVTFLTPSVICTVIDEILYIYDLFAMKMRQYTTLPKDNKIVFSPDGKYLLTFGWYHDVLEIVSVFDAVNLINNPGPGAVYKPMYEKHHAKISFYDYRPNNKLLTLKLSPGHGWSVVSMDKDKLVVKNTSPGFYYDIIFRHPFPHPIFETVEGLSWARIMSDDRLETHLTWPEGIPLTDRKRAKEISREFASLVLPLAAWISNVEGDYSTKSLEEAKRRYILQLVKAIRKEL